MQFVIEEEIFARFSDVAVAVIAARGICNAVGEDEATAIAALLRDAQASIPQRIEASEVTSHPYIAPWREAYRQFGAKPKKYPSSIENLVRRVLKGQMIGSVNPLVDLYNVISLRHLLPIGGEDLDAMQGNLQLTVAGEDEAPVKLLGEAEARAPYADEVIYKDDIGTVCRRWNWKEAERTKLTPQTTNAVLVVESLPPIARATVQQAVDELAALVEQHLGGTLESAMLNHEQRSMTLI